MINSKLIKVEFWQFQLEIKYWQFHISHNNIGCFRYLFRSLAITGSANKVGRSSRGEDDNRSRLGSCGRVICTNERFLKDRRDVDIKGLCSVAAHMAVEVPGGGEGRRAGWADQFDGTVFDSVPLL